MTDAQRRPHWQIRDRNGGREIRLLGHWDILSIAGAGRGFGAQVRALGRDGFEVWDLSHVQALDSAGARLLWQSWGGRYPQNLRCREGQRAWFERLRSLTPARRPPRGGLLGALVSLGKSVSRVGADVAGILLLSGQLMVDLAYCVRHPRAIPWRGIWNTIYRSGVQSLLLMGFIGVLVGIVLVSQIAGNLQKFGVGSQIIGMVGLAFLRELGPFLAAIVLVGRSGSTFTAGIGAMQVTEEIDALRAFGASPTLRLVFPRVLGLALATPLLVIWTNFAGVLGSMWEAKRQLGLPWGMWIARFPDAVPLSNYVIGLSKGALFGLVIGVVASYYGLQVQPNTESLSEYTTRSVVTGISLVIVINSVLSAVLTHSSLTG